MVTATTEGIKVSVETEYLPEYSSPMQNHFAFTYRITIENYSEYTIQIMRRHWDIFDSQAGKKEVEGEGVVGQQPVLEPGQFHNYVSGCSLKTGIGKMKGTYLVERLMDGKQFKVEIPEFLLMVPYRMN